MANRSVLIRVPSSVGNFGGALDCAALALEASLNVKVTPRLDGHVGIRYFGENGERVSRDRSNLVVRAMEAALHLKGLEFTGADYEMYSSVPVGVGLGSSAAAVLAGLLAADQLFRLDLDEKILFDLGAIYESRADNLRAAWYGGFVVGSGEADAGVYQRTVVPENLVLSVVIPEGLPTSSERKNSDSAALVKDRPAHLRRAALFAEFFAYPESNSKPAISNSLLSAWEKSVPGLEEALEGKKPGLLALFVCGAGPAVGILSEGAPEGASEAVRAVRECFAKQGTATLAAEYPLANAGARELNAMRADITLPPARGLTLPLRKAAGIPV